MKALNILTWPTRGSYLRYLSQAPHQFHVLSRPDRPAGHGVHGRQLRWGGNVHALPLEQARTRQFDCILFQERQQFEKDQYAFLSSAQRALPRIYIEHDPPHGHPTDSRHLVDDAGVMLVHVSHFNALMWDNGRTPHRVIEHGVLVPEDIGYRGELDSGLVIINHLAQRGRRLGADLFLAARKQVPLALVGTAAEQLGGQGEVAHGELPALAARYRYLFSPVRHASPGLALIESMMIGMPVVALATTGMSTLIENGVSGYTDANPATLLLHMKELRRDPALARQLGDAARRRARERFGIERFCADWNAVLREVTS